MAVSAHAHAWVRGAHTHPRWRGVQMGCSCLRAPATHVQGKLSADGPLLRRGEDNTSCASRSKASVKSYWIPAGSRSDPVALMCSLRWQI